MSGTKSKPNFILLITVAILVFFGLTMIASAGIILSHENFDQPYFYLKRQLLRGLLTGLTVGVMFFLFPLKKLKKLAGPIFLGTLLLLVLVFVPQIGIEAGGAHRWIKIGPIPFQPTEILKLFLIVYLAAWLTKRGEKIKNFKEGFLPFLLLMGLISALVLAQPDISTLALLLIIAFTIFFLAGGRISHLLGAGVLLLLIFLVMIQLYPHAANRVKAFLDPEVDPGGIGYQSKQAVISIGSGGILGVGLGQSIQKYKYLPEPVGDSIMAIVGEELGFLGLVFLVGLFAVFIYQSIKIAKKAPDKFSKLAAAGITAWIAFQTTVNMAAISGLLPLTGMPLPFISYGSTSLAVSLSAVGLLLNISKEAKK